MHSQADTQHADLLKEKREVEKKPEAERRELAQIYVRRGLEPELARQVAVQLMAHDALGAHARDELGISRELSAKPLSAAFASARSLIFGAALPVAVTLAVALEHVILWISIMSLVFMAALGAVAAKAGGSPLLAGA